jgi:hypothetical protein
MDGISLKGKNKNCNEGNYIDVSKCIICQKIKVGQNVSSTENGRTQIITASETRQDVVTERLRKIAKKHFVYHVDNKCYKGYTLRKTLATFAPVNTAGHDDNSMMDTQDERSTRSKVSARAPPKSHNVAMYRQTCVICGFITHDDDYSKCRISESDRAQKFLEATVYFQDDIYTRTCDLQDINAVFGADIYCHKKCIRLYLRKHEIATMQSTADKDSTSTKTKVFNDVADDIDSDLTQGKGYALSDLRNCCNQKLNSENNFSNREIKVLLIHRYGQSVSFSIPLEANKSAMVFLETFSKHELVEKIRGTDPLQQCAAIIRQELLKQDFALQDKFCDAHDLEESWKSIVIPDTILKFFSILFNFHPDHQQMPSIGTNEVDDDSDDAHASSSKSRKMMALYQTLYFLVHNGKRRTPLHMMNAEAIYSVCKSSTLITSFNHFGLAMSYDELLRYRNDMASYIVENSAGKVPLPSHFDPNKDTIAAFDNFDHDEATESGIGGSHDAVSVLMQDKPTEAHRKPNISQTKVVHGAKQFAMELPCQTQREYFKSAKKPDLPEDFSVADDMFSMDESDHNLIKTKDIAWSLARLDLSNIADIKPVCEEQTMPSWSAFNSVITDETVPQKIIGFLPVIPHPVTEYATVYTALKNFQSILGQLKQSHIAVTGDEGVYHIAREIQLQHPTEFKNIVLCIGSFHMIKVVLGCIGKYIEGSGAETIWVEKEVFGLNVVKSVLAGSHYVRSLKGMLLLSESIERLQWCEFFTENGAQYKHELQLIRDLKEAVASQNRDKSKAILQSFTDCSATLEKEFEDFKSSKSQKSETFAYWENFVQMVYLLRDLIRADREGNWNLHLNSLKSILPMFATFDRTNYLRWASLYMEDMMKLEETAPELYQSFIAGKFVVKRTPGQFKAVGADMCLEQTINRSQKSTAGIIGSTKRKQYVAQWELIYHEMLAVDNTFRQLSGVKVCHSELAVNHEFRKAETDATESKVGDIISYIVCHENPAHVSDATEHNLHNILTQEIMTEDIRNSLLNIHKVSKELYATFRRERYIDKSKRISDTITRNKFKNFKTIHTDVQAKSVKKNDQKKDFAQAQKLIDLARVRDYDIKHLFQYDLVSSNYLFDVHGFMTNPNKSTLCTELEKSLAASDFTHPRQWAKVKCVYVVDVMANVRRVRSKMLKTFGEFLDTFLAMVLSLSTNAHRIDFVFDTYLKGSVKDSERVRRCEEKPIEINNLTRDTPLPVDMATFWSSTTNKQKLQLLLRSVIVENEILRQSDVDVVLSGIGIDDGMTPCEVVSRDAIEPIASLDVHIEEADARLMPHCMHATQDGAKRIVILSNDTDVLVLGVYFWTTFHCQGLHELWIRAGVGDTTRYIPIHTMAQNIGVDTCKILPALHSITGSDTTSKFGTKAAALKANPVQFLQDFGKDPHASDFMQTLQKAEEYLIQVYKRGTTSLKTMDELRFYLYHHSSSASFMDLPSTSFATKGHILRAFYGTYMQLNCLSQNTELDPKNFGFEENDGLLVPSTFARLVPDDLPQSCTCAKCATRRCICRDNGVPCCIYCTCQGIQPIACRNPNVVLRVPVRVPPLNQ